MAWKQWTGNRKNAGPESGAKIYPTGKIVIASSEIEGIVEDNPRYTVQYDDEEGRIGITFGETGKTVKTNNNGSMVFSLKSLLEHMNALPSEAKELTVEKENDTITLTLN